MKNDLFYFDDCVYSRLMEIFLSIRSKMCFIQNNYTPAFAGKECIIDLKTKSIFNFRRN